MEWEEKRLHFAERLLAQGEEDPLPGGARR
jgi:hypothetical protein